MYVCRCTHLCAHWEVTGQLQMSSSINSHLVFCGVLQAEYQINLESAALLDWLVNETQGLTCLLTHPALRLQKWLFGIQTKICMHRKHSAHWAISA